MPTSRVPKPCLERLPDGRGCPQYALPNRSRCEKHQRDAVSKRAISPGTTPEWRRARAKALARAGHRCEECGRTEQQARADGTWLEVHHEDLAGVRAKTHDIDQLRVLCRTPCHTAKMRKKTRPTLEEHKAGIMMRGRVRKLMNG